MDREGNVKERLFIPYFKRVEDWAKRKLEYLKLEDEEMIEKIAIQIAEKCMWIPLRCLIFEMHELKERNMLSGKDSVQMYESYLEDYLGNEKYLLWFEQKYPLIQELISKKIRDTICFVRELLEHLRQDERAVSEELCGGKKFGAVEDMELYRSDEHVSGKTVTRLRLDNGCTVYYKPKDLSVSRFYQDAYKWLAERCGRDTFPYPMVCRKTYGWEKEIAPMPCQCEEAAEEYYKNIGMHLSLAYVLGVTDIHFENVIAHGEHPVITDVEFLGNMGCIAFTEKKNLQDHLKDNALSTGLMPVRSWLGGSNNVSGIGDTSDQRLPVKMPVISNRGTSDMAIGYDYPRMRPGKNVPVLNGEKCDYRKYVRQILSGFEAGYTCILQNRDAFAGEFQHRFYHAGRVLFRNTQEYSMYANMLNFPELMQSEPKKRALLGHMGKGLTCRGEYREWVLGYEMKSVYGGEIPVFHAEGRNLVAGDGEVLEDYYGSSSGERIIVHMGKLSEKDRELQKRIICVQFYSLFRRQGAEIAGEGSLYPELWQLTPEKIAGYLIETMWDTGGKYEWATLFYKETSICLGAADNYLYGGISGMALFFAALGKRKHNPVYNRVFEGLTRRMKQHTDRGIKAGDGLDGGLFAGEPSVIYAYLLLYNITEEESFLSYAKKHAGLIMACDISRIEEDDLLGGKAGVMIAYVKLYEHTGSTEYLDFAAAAAELLLAGARKEEGGVRWNNAGQGGLAGMAHGNSGIALAFAMLWKHCRSDKYMRCVKEALFYEDALYDEELCNWLDMREHEKSGKGKDTVAWCHGCGGILFARKRIHELTGLSMGECFDIELESKLLAARKEDCCLCHGGLGIHSALRQISEEKAGRYREKIKDQRLSFEDMNNVGFMNGLAGIGYALLGEDGIRLPNVLEIE